MRQHRIASQADAHRDYRFPCHAQYRQYALVLPTFRAPTIHWPAAYCEARCSVTITAVRLILHQPATVVRNSQTDRHRAQSRFRQVLQWYLQVHCRMPQSNSPHAHATFRAVMLQPVLLTQSSFQYSGCPRSSDRVPWPRYFDTDNRYGLMTLRVLLLQPAKGRCRCPAPFPHVAHKTAPHRSATSAPRYRCPLQRLPQMSAMAATGYSLQHQPQSAHLQPSQYRLRTFVATVSR